MQYFQWVFLIFLFVIGCSNDPYRDLTKNTQQASTPHRLSSFEMDTDGDGMADVYAALTYDSSGNLLTTQMNEKLIYFKQQVLSGMSDEKQTDAQTDLLNEGQQLCVIHSNGARTQKNLYSNSGKTLYTLSYAFDDANDPVTATCLSTEDDVVTTRIECSYTYAFSGVDEAVKIPVKQSCESESGPYTIYYRYDDQNIKTERKKPVTIEYDLDNDFNIDVITSVSYNTSGNPVTETTIRLSNTNGQLSSDLYTVHYFWEEGKSIPVLDILFLNHSTPVPYYGQ